jgi:hypothetical protein
MRLRSIAPGDIVLVNKRGRVFHALVRGRTAAGDLLVDPLDRRITYRHATAQEINDHWRRGDRRDGEPGAPADGQLALIEPDPPAPSRGGRFGRSA